MYIIKRSIILNISELLVNGKHLLKDIEDGNIKARILLEYILKLSREKIVSNPNTCLLYTSPSPRDRG